MRKYLSYFFVGIVLLSCGNKHNTILTVAEMKPIIWEMLNADNLYSQNSISDTSFKSKKANVVYYDKIFKQYDITKEQFYNSYKFYELHPQKMKILLDSVEAFGMREKANLDKPLITKSKK